jgi:hypothetical protein
MRNINSLIDANTAAARTATTARNTTPVVQPTQQIPPTRSAASMPGLPNSAPTAPQNSTTRTAFSAPVEMKDAATQTGPTRTNEVGTQTVHHDVHNHSLGPGYSPSQIYNVAQTLGESANQQMKFFNDAGVEKFVWSPIPTNITAGHAHASCGNEHHSDDTTPHIGGETYYMPDQYRDGAPLTLEAYLDATKRKQYYDLSVDFQVARAYEQMDEAAKSRIFPAITGLHLGDANSVHQILRLFTEYPKTFYIFGECTMKKEFVDEQNQNYKPDFGPNAPIGDIFRFAGRSGRPFILHCDSSDVKKCKVNNAAGQGEYFDDINQMFQRHPNTKFIWAHMGGIGKFGPPSENHVQKLREILENNPHVRVDMSWDVVAKYFAPLPVKPFDAQTDPAEHAKAEAERLKRDQFIQDMAQLIGDYPDRFIMGSDALVSRSQGSIDTTYGIYSNYGRGPGTAQSAGLFDRLPVEVLNRVLTENFESMMQQAVIDGDHYEKEVMPADLARIQATINEKGRVPNTWPSDNNA